jgi:hypothetical protein
MNEASYASARLYRLADYRRDAWSMDDTLWESTTFEGAARLISGDPITAGALLARAARLAERAFAPDDPRYAAAWTNLARLLRCQGEVDSATSFFATACAAWLASAAWLDRLRVGDSGLSSPQCRRLLNEGRRHADALASGRPSLLPCGLERWRGRRDTGPSDRRKLMAAVFLSTFRMTG